MEPGLTNTIQGSATEDSERGEGRVYYDIRTYLKLPGEDETRPVKILLNVEAQKDDTPGYHPTERAIYYGCRMISSQLDVEFTNRSDDPVKYGNIKKVYSIWLCTESAEKRTNRIVRYKMQEQLVFPQDGESASDRQRYDMMQIIMIYLSRKHTGHDSENALICMLTDLFDESIGAEEKIRLLETKHHLPMGEPMKKEVKKMTVFSAAIAERSREPGMQQGIEQGMQRGIERGMQQGIERGLEQGRAEFIRAMLRNDKSPEAIAEFCNIDLAEVKQVEEAMLLENNL
jgi:predicted transposase/invertase (TIGR01784 family)